jgi:hypothetical protein
MKRIFALASIFLLPAACQREKSTSDTSVHRPSVFEVVVSDLVTKEPIHDKFVGSKVMVVSRWNEGDSLFYDLEDYPIKISDELLDALKAKSESKEPFPAIEAFGPNAILTSDQPLYYLDYFGDEVDPVQGKCFVRFWRPGFSKDQKRAIVRAWYGPESHDFVATYLLAQADTGWTILGSFLTEYP